ncbi:MAG: AAA family ATPase [Hormoscilla sp. SP12CHS1]|nr:AAA family ATPase [Hormoscilla sp. SP12CHS1]
MAAPRYAIGKPIPTILQIESEIMLRSFTIKNFRCFQQLTVTPLERVNLIGGKNNLGKTSLLEAILISINPTNPKVLFHVNRLRRIPGEESLEALEATRVFFFNQDGNETIELSTVDEKDNTSSLRIFLFEEDPSLFDEDIPGNFPANQSLTTEVMLYDRLVLEYQDQTGKKKTSFVYWQAGYWRVKSSARTRRKKFPLGIYITSRPALQKQMQIVLVSWNE